MRVQKQVSGGSNGVSVGLGATVGGQNGAGVGAGVGTGTGVGAGIGVGGTNASNPSNTSLPGVVADMSDSQVARMKQRCVDVLNSSGSYDRDLRQLCLLISRR
ncbi:hypothetical protein ASD99_28095 [Mesorhizobium sp. Root695]|jgi:hypothetical protein|uniref:hypothetical protein n=1 Tax=Mesorhizobium sp. Root695 TaxID=1736589 RepID=UPI00070CFBC9|nr:hypothetical protein [Mesorhizobium sp. Root695]KRB25643.1 hypothetical protein ASD99_28095 [Mesorhizobium sp. Root695]